MGLDLALEVTRASTSGACVTEEKLPCPVTVAVALGEPGGGLHTAQCCLPRQHPHGREVRPCGLQHGGGSMMGEGRGLHRDGWCQDK